MGKSKNSGNTKNVVGPWQTALDPNLSKGYNIYEAAMRNRDFIWAIDKNVTPEEEKLRKEVRFYLNQIRSGMGGSLQSLPGDILYRELRKWILEHPNFDVIQGRFITDKEYIKVKDYSEKTLKELEKKLRSMSQRVDKWYKRVESETFGDRMANAFSSKTWSVIPRIIKDEAAPVLENYVEDIGDLVMNPVENTFAWIKDISLIAGPIVGLILFVMIKK
jgi:hypothetical protein